MICIQLNSLWPSDAIWHHRSRSTLGQVMACCLTAPTHYLTQCWLIISDNLWQGITKTHTPWSGNGRMHTAYVGSSLTMFKKVTDTTHAKISYQIMYVCIASEKLLMSWLMVSTQGQFHRKCSRCLSNPLCEFENYLSTYPQRAMIYRVMWFSLQNWNMIQFYPTGWGYMTCFISEIAINQTIFFSNELVLN